MNITAYDESKKAVKLAHGIIINDKDFAILEAFLKALAKLFGLTKDNRRIKVILSDEGIVLFFYVDFHMFIYLFFICIHDAYTMHLRRIYDDFTF